MRWRELLREASRRLADAGIEQAPFEARLLAADAAGLKVENLVLARDQEVPAAQQEAVQRAIARRSGREPASQILGWREFWGLRFLVDNTVLTPRPDSETLIEATLGRIADRNRPLRLLDLGTGSGCLALALLSELPNAQAVAVDRSPQALTIAARNAHALGLADRIVFRCGSWTAGLAGSFEIAVCNPPYIPTAEITRLEPEVRNYEPRLALDGGADGLAAYRTILGDLPTMLEPAAVLALEVGAGQAAGVAQLVERAGFSNLARHRDLAGIERVVSALLAPASPHRP